MKTTERKKTAFLIRIAAAALAAATVFGVLVGYGRRAAAETYPRQAIISSDGSNVNVREGPGTNYRAIVSLPDRTVVTLIGEDRASDGAKWYKIRFSHPSSGADTEGYMHQTYLVYTDDSGLLPDEKRTFEELLSEFPASYQQPLLNLHDMYRSWKFVAVKTGLDWQTALDEESAKNRSLVAASAISSWKSLEGDSYDWNTGVWKGRDGAKWVTASKDIVAYYLDPRNYLDGSLIFAFMTHGYDPAAQTLDGVRSVIGNSFMAQDFQENGQTYSYAGVLMEAGLQYGVSPYVLAAMIRIEIGYDGKSASVSGTEPGYENLYNYYNVGAYAEGGRTANQRGLWWANGAGTNDTSYGRPWNSRYKALLGGAEYYASNYTKAGQTTLYLKKFNVGPDHTRPLYEHQYMTNIQGAASEANVYSLAYSAEAKQQELVFYIPVYENMPETPAVRPTRTGSPNNKLDSISVNGEGVVGFHMDTASYRVEVTSDVEKIMLEATPKDGTARIDGVGELPLVTGENLFTITVTAQNGDVRTYQVTVVRPASADAALSALGAAESALAPEFDSAVTEYWMSIPAEQTALTVTASANDAGAQVEITAAASDTKEPVALDNLAGAANFTVTVKVTASDGVTVKEYHITVERIVSDPDVTVASGEYTVGGDRDGSAGYITGVDDFGTEGFSVESFAQKFEVGDGGSVSVVTADGMTPAEKIGTGTLVKVYNAEGQLCGVYPVVIYGDVSGDGKTNAADFLRVYRDVMNYGSLSGIYSEAADVNHDSAVNAIDFLRIYKRVMEYENSAIPQR